MSGLPGLRNHRAVSAEVKPESLHFGELDVEQDPIRRGRQHREQCLPWHSCVPAVPATGHPKWSSLWMGLRCSKQGHLGLPGACSMKAPSLNL